MTADQDALAIEQGTAPNPTGFNQGWMSRVFARKVLGDNVNKQPFTRTMADTGQQVVATPMSQDKVTGIADAVAWRRINAVPADVPNMPDVVDVGDILVIWWEYFKLTADPATLAQAITNAQAFPKWPAGYAGAASFDTGGD
jgi:hypothetical protein